MVRGLLTTVAFARAERRAPSPPHGHLTHRTQFQRFRRAPCPACAVRSPRGCAFNGVHELITIVVVFRYTLMPVLYIPYTYFSQRGRVRRVAKWQGRVLRCCEWPLLARAALEWLLVVCPLWGGSFAPLLLWVLGRTSSAVSTYVARCTCRSGGPRVTSWLVCQVRDCATGGGVGLLWYRPPRHSGPGGLVQVTLGEAAQGKTAHRAVEGADVVLPPERRSTVGGTCWWATTRGVQAICNWVASARRSKFLCGPSCVAAFRCTRVSVRVTCTCQLCPAPATRSPATPATCCGVLFTRLLHSCA